MSPPTLLWALWSLPHKTSPLKEQLKHVNCKVKLKTQRGSPMFSTAWTIHPNLVSTVQKQQAVPARHSGPQKTVCHRSSSEAGTCGAGARLSRGLHML